MTRTAPYYGRRGRLDAALTGVRPTASTYGKARFGTHSDKADGHLSVESEAERFVTHLLTIDPRVRTFRPQPFTVDLTDQRLLFTKEARREAWLKHRDVEGAKFYTVDFSIEWNDGLNNAVEVKSEGFEGDDIYWDKVDRARPVLEANGYPLRTVVAPAETRHPVRFNARLLKQARNHVQSHLTEALIARVTQRCAEGPISMAMLCRDLDLPSGIVPVLLIGGVLTGDLARHAISGALALSLAYGELDHLCLLEEVER